MFVLEALGRALQLSFFMFWEVLWPLALGFLLSAAVQTVVSKRAVAGALGRPNLKGFALACGFGAASSSCSYAAVAVARTLFRKGASFVNAIVFEFASTNLVIELGLVLLILLGWQFLAAEFAGGLLMAAILWIVFKLTLRRRLVEEAREQAERGLVGSSMEGHGEMDMSRVREGTREVRRPRARPRGGAFPRSPLRRLEGAGQTVRRPPPSGSRGARRPATGAVPPPRRSAPGPGSRPFPAPPSAP